MERFLDAYTLGELDDFFDCPRPPHTLPVEAGANRPRAALAAALKGYAVRLGAHQAVLEAADRLAQPGSVAVVTGQQAGLLAGPNFTLSKAMTAVSIARRIDRADAPAVPVFWVASQDHDIAEIDHTWLLDLDERLWRVEVPLPAGVPASSIPLPAGLDRLLTAQLRSGNWPAELTEEFVELHGSAAAVAGNWAELFSALLFRVLGPDAPLIIDPAQPDVAPLFSRVIEQELEDPLASAEAVNSAGSRLSRLGFTPQLGRGQAATNLFLTSTGDGLPQRELLRFDGSKFYTSSARFSRADLQAILEAQPGRLTPAAGLRPVTQDAVLPTTALVVGPGELRYFAQLRDVYRRHGVRQPTIWPRPELTVLEPPVARILRQLDIDPAELQDRPEEVSRRLLLQRSAAARQFSDSLKQLRASQNALNEAVLGFEPTLKGAVDRHSERVAHSLGKLEDKAAEAVRRRDAVLANQLSRLQAQLLPRGSRQERVISPVSYFLKFGTGAVLRLYRDLPEQGRHFRAV